MSKKSGSLREWNQAYSSLLLVGLGLFNQNWKEAALFGGLTLVSGIAFNYFYHSTQKHSEKVNDSKQPKDEAQKSSTSSENQKKDETGRNMRKIIANVRISQQFWTWESLPDYSRMNKGIGSPKKTKFFLLITPSQGSLQN